MYPTGPEHRDASELQNIVKQLPGLPIYLGHPKVFPAKDSGQKVVGTVESGRLDEDTAVGRLAITDQEALDAIESGTYELSLGYRCYVDSEKYQRAIVLDHLAIVKRARCGSVCALRTDMLLEEVEEVKMGTIEIPVNITLTDEAKVLETLSKVDCTCQHGDKDLNAKARNALGAEEFAVPESRKLPIPDESHVRAAMSRFGQTEFASSAEKRSAFHRIIAKAHKFGIETSGFEKAWEGRLDGGSTNCTCNIRAINHNIGETMSDVNKDTELQGKLSAAMAEIATLKARITELEVEATNARKDADAAKAALEASKADAEKAKADAEAAVAQAKADADDAAKAAFEARVDARVALLTEAGRFDLKDAEGNKLELNKLSDREIKCAVIKHVDGDEVPADKPDAFVDGVYSGSLKRGAAAAGSREAVRIAVNEMRKDATNAAANRPLTGRAAEEAAKEAMKRESALAWTK